MIEIQKRSYFLDLNDILTIFWTSFLESPSILPERFFNNWLFLIGLNKILRPYKHFLVNYTRTLFFLKTVLRQAFFQLFIELDRFEFTANVSLGNCNLSQVQSRRNPISPKHLDLQNYDNKHIKRSNALRINCLAVQNNNLSPLLFQILVSISSWLKKKFSLILLKVFTFMKILVNR